MPIYHCTHCHYTFEQDGEAKSCPDCGKQEVRSATEAEIEELKHYPKDELDN